MVLEELDGCAFSNLYPPWVFGTFCRKSGSRSAVISWLHRKVARARARLRKRNELGLEIFALRHQIAVLRRTGTRCPRFNASDRLLWVFAVALVARLAHQAAA
jgi:hypothetical protein